MVRLIRRYRSIAYKSAKWFGDLQAVLTGRIPQRIGWRITGKWTSQALGSLWR